MDVGCTTSSVFFSTSSHILEEYRVTGGAGRFRGPFRGSWSLRTPWIGGYWEVYEGLGGEQEFSRVPAVGGLPEFGRGETLGVPGFGGLWGPWDLGDPRSGGAGRFAESWECLPVHPALHSWRIFHGQEERPGRKILFFWGRES